MAEKAEDVKYREWSIWAEIKKFGDTLRDYFNQISNWFKDLLWIERKQAEETQETTDQTKSELQTLEQILTWKTITVDKSLSNEEKEILTQLEKNTTIKSYFDFISQDKWLNDKQIISEKEYIISILKTESNDDEDNSKADLWQEELTAMENYCTVKKSLYEKLNPQPNFWTYIESFNTAFSSVLSEEKDITKITEETLEYHVRENLMYNEINSDEEITPKPDEEKFKKAFESIYNEKNKDYSKVTKEDVLNKANE